jgi:hypothetical protein
MSSANAEAVRFDLAGANSQVALTKESNRTSTNPLLASYANTEYST